MVRPEFRELRQREPILIQIDLVKGLAGDRESVTFLRDFIQPWGIVSTKSALIDSILENALVAAELMPGLAPAPITEIRDAVGLPAIAAGLIRIREHALTALDAGADAISMSATNLWNEALLTDLHP